MTTRKPRRTAATKTEEKTPKPTPEVVPESPKVKTKKFIIKHN